MFCARDAILAAGNTAADNNHPCSRGGGGGGGGMGPVVDEEEEASFLLVLGDHLYRRGPGTTQACASQLLHAFLEHGEAGKPAIGLKVRRGNVGKTVTSVESSDWPACFSPHL